MDNSIASIAKRLDMKHNVSIRVIDEISGEVVSEHVGHNASTNSMLTGLAHYLTGDGVLNQGEILELWVPQYISLGTMGLLNQDEDEEGLPAGVGVRSYKGMKYNQLTDEVLSILKKSPSSEIISEEDEECIRFRDYLMQCPGYGADGYDVNLNNGRPYLGLGPAYNQREREILNLHRGDINLDGDVTEEDLLLLLEYVAGTNEVDFSHKQKAVADVNGDGVINDLDVKLVKKFLRGEITIGDLGTIDYENPEDRGPAINCELIINPEFDDTTLQEVKKGHPRSPISYREIVPEAEAEYPETIDVIFSAFISTGALSKYKQSGRDYLYVSEVGLWSRPDWIDGGDNGLLAGYRICPPDEENWDMTVPENRKILKENLIRIGPNQVAQIIWKVQLGAIKQLGGIDALYPSQLRLRWIIWPEV